MNTKVKNKVTATIILLGGALLMVSIGEFVAIYYENIDSEVPRWLYFVLLVIFIPILGLAYAKFINVLSKGKKLNSKNNLKTDRVIYI